MNSGPPELEEIYVFGNQLVIYYLPTYLPTYHTLPKLITFVIQWRRFATYRLAHTPFVFETHNSESVHTGRLGYVVF